jgi:hypothetical protein
MPTSVDIPRELNEQVERRIIDYSVGLVRLSDGDDGDAWLGGSGTLVKAGQHQAILTAAHVVDYLWKTTEFGVVIPRTDSGQRHRLTFQTKLLEKVVMPREKKVPENLPPDIALILLPSAQASDIAASKSFWDLSRDRDELLSDSPHWNLGFWVMSGFADEWTAEHPPERGCYRLVAFNGRVLHGLAEPLANSECSAWQFSITRSSGYDGPSSFGGYSGGGLWQILFQGAKDAVRVKNILLSGVAYYQSGFQNDLNIVHCNGREHIYGFALDALRR